MATEVITTSLVVSFGQPEEASTTNLFTVEVDDREDGPNQGKTSGWIPGDTVYLLLYKPEGARLLNWVASQGSLGRISDTTKPVEDFLQFQNEPEVTVRYPVPSTFSGSWMGNNLGSVVRFNEATMKLTSSSLPDPYAGVYKINYNSPAESWVLSNTYLPEEEDPIIVFFQAEIDT